MKTRSVIAMLALAVVGSAAEVHALDLTGNNLELNGSDALFDVTQDILAACPSAVADGISYFGGGSGLGAFLMLDGPLNQVYQQVTPMSRPLKSGEYCGVSLDEGQATKSAIQQTTQSLMIGLDAVSIVANGSSACSNALAFGGAFSAFSVTDTSGSSAVNCSGCDAGTNTYHFQDSLDLLRLIFGGLHHDGTFDCNGNVRRSLVRQWSTLFSAGCANCSAGLTHVWRPSDLSGTADSFVSLVGFGSRAIGTPIRSPNPTRSQNPFCNSADANSTATVSFGGSSDFSDLDPIRIRCPTTDQVCSSVLSSDGSALTATSGTLGLVLPILLPDNFDNSSETPLQSDIYPNRFCSAGKFDLVSTGNNHEKCPGGPNFLGKCFQPYFAANSSDTHHFACISKQNAAAFGTPSGTDGRAWNLALAPDNSGGSYFVNRLGGEMNASFFRIHTTTPAAGSAVTCQNHNQTDQIGCLVNADPCSLGLAAHGAVAQTNTEALAINDILPTVQSVGNLLTSNGPIYPLARRLFVTSLIGFANLQGGESALAHCYADNNVVRSALLAHDYFVLPSPGIRCLSYDDSPLPGCGDTPSVTNCGAPPGTQIPLITNGF